MQTQITLLEKMTLLHNLMIEFQGSVGSLNNHGSPDCNRLRQIFDTVQALPQMDVTGTDLTVQQAYAAYRSAIDHFTKPENPPSDVATLCQTQPENLPNISGQQINAVVLYIEQSDNLMENAWRAIGGR